MSLIRLSTLGATCIEGTIGPALPTRGKLVALLVYLSRSTGAVRREELAALLWGDKPEALARQSLRHALMGLRRAVGNGALVVSTDDVRLTAGAFELDAAQFESALAAGRLADAVALWHGDFLEGFEDTGSESWRLWLESEREGLRRRLAYAFGRLVDEAEGCADWDGAAQYAECWAAALPLDDRAQLRWIQMLRLAGRSMDALAAHARQSHRLHDLGVEPSPAFLRIGEELARGAHAQPRAITGSPAFLTADLIGRSSAFAALVAGWHAAQSNQGVVMLVDGDQGTGKTRLIEEFVRWHAEHGGAGLVLRARAFDSENNVAYSTARELLSGLRTAPGLSGAPNEALAELADMVPSISGRFRNLPQAQGSPEARVRALFQVLGDVAAELPVLLVLDDVPSADVESARLLLSLARRPPGGVAVLLTARTACLEETGYERELRNAPACRRIRLQQLDLTETEALIASMLEMEIGARRGLAERIFAETSGNPLYIVELIAALAAEARLFIGPHGLWELDATRAGHVLPLPESVTAIMRVRTEHLDVAARTALEAAALLGSKASIDRVAALTQLRGDQLDAAIGQLISHKLVRASAGSVEFMHEIVRRSVHAAIPPARRQRYERLLSGSTRRFPRRRRLAAAGAVVALASIGIFSFSRTPAVNLPTLAVGSIIDRTGSDSATSVMPARDLLATRLATLNGLGVISPERMHELHAQLASSPEAMRGVDAARQAGADQVLQGSMVRAENGELRLELRRVNLETGTVAAAYSLEAADLLTLVDAATKAIARDFGIPVQPGQPGMPASLVAYRMYEEGLRAFYQGDAAAAHRFFAAALVEDSTFAMAAFYDWTSKFWAGLAEPEADLELARVVRLAERAPERESLLIRAMWASHVHAPERLALAETLAIRYPREPDGHHLVGQAKYAAGDFLGAVPHFRHVISMDTLSARNATLRCRACDALAQIIAAYSLADSMPAAERAAREWTRLQPATARPWVYLATTLEYQNQFQNALGARRKAAAYQPGNRSDPVYPARVSVRQGNYAHADPMLRQLMSDGPAAVSRQAAWFLIISLRQQGRLQAALAVAREYSDTLSQAVIQLEMGNAQKSAAWFETYAAGRKIEDPLVRHVNHRMWQLAHAATARAAAGDTIALRRLADELAELGTQTSSGRNHKLHHYVLGLLHSARGDHKQAVTAYESSIHSLTNAFGRINLELARSLLAINQPQRAVHVLEAALRGPLDAGNYYTPHTDLRELLGMAYEAAALPDSAVVQYRRVWDAWSTADPSFQTRRAFVRARLDAMMP